MDKLTKEQRSGCMSKIKGKNTELEKLFWKSVAELKIKGYRRNTKNIGKPDLYFSNHKIAVFIDGCFWHGCPRCYTSPATNRKFWADKIRNNIKRDRTVNSELRKDGVKVVRFWGHTVRRNPGLCAQKLREIIEKYK
jgi:DNA mismatch endonuclease (patch repair protein)